MSFFNFTVRMQNWRSASLASTLLRGHRLELWGSEHYPWRVNWPHNPSVECTGLVRLSHVSESGFRSLYRGEAQSNRTSSFGVMSDYPTYVLGRPGQSALVCAGPWTLLSISAFSLSFTHLLQLRVSCRFSFSSQLTWRECSTRRDDRQFHQ